MRQGKRVNVRGVCSFTSAEERVEGSFERRVNRIRGRGKE